MPENRKLVLNQETLWRLTSGLDSEKCSAVPPTGSNVDCTGSEGTPYCQPPA
jgi:hypothetical protein